MTVDEAVTGLMPGCRGGDGEAGLGEYPRQLRESWLSPCGAASCCREDGGGDAASAVVGLTAAAMCCRQGCCGAGGGCSPGCGGAGGEAGVVPTAGDPRTAGSAAPGAKRRLCGVTASGARSSRASALQAGVLGAGRGH